jgi:hypothetical protein
MWGKDGKSKFFDRQAVIFYDDPMEAITLGPPIFQVQKYSSCSKAGGCWTAELLGAFRGNLLIVSWVTPTPGCTANFPGNPCSQPLIFGFIPQIWSRATCRVSGQTISHQFFVVYS